MTTSLTVAVVDAEDEFRSDLIRFLKADGFSVWGVPSAEGFYRKLVASPADIVLANLSLPGESGLSLVAYLRDVGRYSLVALVDDPCLDDHFASLEAGADLFFAKSVKFPILAEGLRTLMSQLSRAEVVKPRRQPDPPDVAWQLDADGARLVAPSQAAVSLASRELKLLQCLLATPGKPVLKAQLLAALGFRDDYLGFDRVDVLLSSLRRKVEKETGLSLPVRSHFGKGLVFVVRGERRA